MKTVTVDAQALHELLHALLGPPHLIREIQALRGSAFLFGRNAIDILIADYNKAVTEFANQDPEEDMPIW